MFVIEGCGLKGFEVVDAGGNIWTQEGEFEEILYRTLVPIVCCTHPKGSATCCQGIHGYVCVMATLKLTLHN
jgi:hypothetical protein